MAKTNSYQKQSIHWKQPQITFLRGKQNATTPWVTKEDEIRYQFHVVLSVSQDMTLLKLSTESEVADLASMTCE